MTTELVTLAVAVLMKDGEIQRITTSSNVQDYTFWRSILDQVWMQQVQGRGAGNEAQAEVEAKNVGSAPPLADD